MHVFNRICHKYIPLLEIFLRMVMRRLKHMDGTL
jgi:hypothetical protein